MIDKPLTIEQVRQLKRGDKLKCIDVSYWIDEGVYIFDGRSNDELLWVVGKRDGFYHWRFTLYNSKTPKGNKICNVH